MPAKLSLSEWAGSMETTRNLRGGKSRARESAEAAAQVVFPTPPLPPKSSSFRSVRRRKAGKPLAEVAAVAEVAEVAEYKEPTLLELAAKAIEETKERRSAGVAAAHANASQATKKEYATHNGVRVTIGEETATFTSLEVAINSLGVPKLFSGYKGQCTSASGKKGSSFTGFRIDLKALRTKSYSKDGVEYVFAIAE